VSDRNPAPALPEKILSTLKRWGKESLRCVGLEVKRVRPADLQRSAFPRTPFEAQKRLLEQRIADDIVIFDVGANKGQTATKFRSLFPSASIYCFEPFPEALAMLRNTHLHDPRVHVVPSAVADRQGTSTFYVNEYDATNSLLPRPHSERRYFPKFAGPKATTTVPTLDLDSFTAEHGIATVDILKLDIQGSELKALAGAESLLRAGGAALIYTEIMFIPHYENAPLFHDLSAHLANLGYSLVDVYDLHRAKNGQLRYGDALFIHNALRSAVMDSFPEEP